LLMKDSDRKWLPHLKNAIPEEAFGYKLCMYTIALEAWRRGLNVKFCNVFFDGKRRVRFSLSDGSNEYKFAVSRGSKVSKEANHICVNKALTKDYLQKNNVPAPIGYKFDLSEGIDYVLNKVSSLGFPLVVKPTDSGAGNGVFANIKTREELIESIEVLWKKLNFNEIIVEQYVEGDDFRVYVIGDRVVGAVTRIPAHIYGDGENSIDFLIDEKNKRRKLNPYTHGRLIKKDRELIQQLKKNGWSLKDVPAKDQLVYLREKSNVSAGGDAIEVTNQLTDKVKEIAIEAINAVPGLIQGAVDIVADLENNVGHVIEINSKPQIAMHLFPEQGEAQDVPAAIIDYYFPNSVNNRRIYSYYFDFKCILKPLENNLVKEIQLPPAPKFNHNRVWYLVSGKVQGVGYRKWIAKKAKSLELNGFVENLSNGNVKVVISGRKAALEKFDKIINQDKPRKAKVNKVAKKRWTKPIKMGFEIINKENQDTQNNIANYEELKESYLKLEKKYNTIINSRSWRLTALFRKFK
ncbi:acylphosphatase, partial [Amphibacillus sediminis]|uniref:acylphosphatase n=1 Tax=Amphibacillus sediminis TaxID=360185 RepID=UPI00083181F4